MKRILCIGRLVLDKDVQKSVLSKTPVATIEHNLHTEDYPLWEDPDSLKMLAIIKANNKRHQ